MKEYLEKYVELAKEGAQLLGNARDIERDSIDTKNFQYARILPEDVREDSVLDFNDHVICLLSEGGSYYWYRRARKPVTFGEFLHENGVMIHGDLKALGDIVLQLAEYGQLRELARCADPVGKMREALKPVVTGEDEPEELFKLSGPPPMKISIENLTINYK